MSYIINTKQVYLEELYKRTMIKLSIYPRSQPA